MHTRRGSRVIGPMHRTTGPGHTSPLVVGNSYPDIAKAHEVAVILECDRLGTGSIRYPRLRVPSSRTQSNILLNELRIEYRLREHGVLDLLRRHAGVPTRRLEFDFVGIPDQVHVARHYQGRRD